MDTNKIHNTATASASAALSYHSLPKNNNNNNNQPSSTTLGAEFHDNDGEEAFLSTSTSSQSHTFSSIILEPVFPLIQRVRLEVTSLIDTTLTYEQLKSPAVNFSVVRPLLLKLSKGDRPPSPLIHALLVNRVQFLNEAEKDLAFVGVNTTRADLCELISIKLLSAYSPFPSLSLLHILTTSFNPYHGATLEMFAPEEGMTKGELERLQGAVEESSSALELAVFSGAKRFVKSPLCQQIVKAIYTGDITYQPTSTHSLISDNYKRKPVVSVYDWRDNPFIDHYRLRVPMIRNRMELVAFMSLMGLFLITQATRDCERVNLWEGLFIFWSLGFALDEIASILENGLHTYFLGLYNILDSSFCFVFFAYLSIRISGLLNHDLERSELAFDTLAMGACILFPRLSISLIKGNVVLLALSAMIKEFLLFMGLAALTASGFLVALKVLARGTTKWGFGKISWLMFKIWLGNSYLGFEAAQDFHPVFGPILIVCFAILSQTLLLTILISLLSNTFAAVQANAATELINQKALRTIERVKSDALASYIPPLNLVAFIILLPLRYMTNPRWFHKINVLLIETFNFPVLLLIALNTRAKHKSYGRSTASRISLRTQQAFASIPHGVHWEGSLDGVGRVFNREMTSKAMEVASIDAEDSGVEDADQAEEQTVKGEGEDQETITPLTPTVSRDSFTPLSPTKRSTSRAKPAGRLGSLGSPLAKMFSLPLNSTRSNTKPTGRDVTARKSLTKDQGLDDRLEKIEKMLGMLLGEVVKGKEAEGNSSTTGRSKVGKLPLRGMYGEIEERYDSGEE